MAYKTLEERYSRDLILRCTLIHNTYDFGYCPIVFINPKGLHKSKHKASAGEYVLYQYDLKAYYMFKVWEQAKKNTDEKYFYWDKFLWYYNPDDYFKKMVHYNERRYPDAKAFFWKELERIANSQTIYVEETVSITPDERIIILNSLGSYTGPNTYVEPIEKIKLENPKRRTWGWNDIKDFFVELSISEIEFLNGKNLNQCTTRDLALFEACSHCNLEEIKNAVANGANVNSLDYNGYSPLQYLLEQDNIYNYFSDIPDDQDIPEERIKDFFNNLKLIINYLLDQGLNINLYGFDDGEDSILSAHWLGNPEFIEFLIQKGARINQNPFVTSMELSYDSFLASGTYDFVETDIAIGDYDTESLLKEEKILEKAGIKYYIDGWDNDKISAFFDELTSKIIYD